MTKVMYKVSAKNGTNVRYETLNGARHMVVPVIMIVEGVLNGSFVPADEFIPQAWNGRPVTVGHPQLNGQDVSANSPKILEKYALGQIFGAKREGDKLKAEAWIDLGLAQKMKQLKLVDALRAGVTMEVSTGYFAATENASGEVDGEPFFGIHRDIKPDHLALLPHDIGACSVNDGCGVRANQQQKEQVAMSTKKQELVDGLIANAKCPFAIDDKELLANMSEEKLQTFVEGFKEKEAEKGDESKAVVNKGCGCGGGAAVVTQKAELSPEDKAALEFARNMVSDRRKSLISEITSNSQMKAEDLADIATNVLEKMALGFKPTADYSGRGFGTQLETQVAEEGVLEAMTPPNVFAMKKERDNRRA